MPSLKYPTRNQQRARIVHTKKDAPHKYLTRVQIYCIPLCSWIAQMYIKYKTFSIFLAENEEKIIAFFPLTWKVNFLLTVSKEALTVFEKRHGKGIYE